MNTNTVTISHSCIDTLPPGDYHYSLFSGIDIFALNDDDKTENLKSKINDLEDERERLSKDLELAEEQVWFAKEIFDTLLRNKGRFDRDFVKSVIDDFNFEL